MIFPPHELANDDGLLAFGGKLDTKTLLEAYQYGIFPWPHEEVEPILWFSPPERAILEFQDFKIPKRLQRELKNCKFHFKINQNFRAVISECSKIKNRKNQSGTWIRNDIIEAYCQFHEAGYACSFESYNQFDELVGGLYGVKIKNFFAGESMFYRENNASKFALIQAVKHLKNEGLTWIDIQSESPLLSMFGASLIPRKDFLSRLKEALR